MKPNKLPGPRGRRPFVMAMVLGTALSGLATGSPARAAAAEISTGTLSSLSRYCTACWRNAHLPVHCWGDCTQEVFCRLLDGVAPERWTRLLAYDSEERREFIRAIDAVKKRTRRQIRRWSPLTSVVADTRGPGSYQRQHDREAVQAAAASMLSSRQERIVQLSLDGWPVQDIADELGLSAERVSDEKYKAIRKLRSHFRV
jgi:RNA polymerase sigma factor (sigma-70 family)